MESQRNGVYDWRRLKKVNVTQGGPFMDKLSHQQYFFDGFTLDLMRGCLLHGENEVKLRPKSFAVLKYLVEHNGCLISKDQLIQAIWIDTAVTDDSLVKCLKDIRRALHDDAQQIIRTVPRRGYIFAAGVNEKIGRQAFTTVTAESSAVQVIIEEETNGDKKRPALSAARRVALIPEPTIEGRRPLTGVIKRYRWLLAVAGLLTLSMVVATAIYLTRPGEAIDSIAVLPFVNESNHPEMEYLSDGISDSVVGSLTQLPNLKRVVPFSSALRYKGKEIDPQKIGRQLNVRAVLTGRLAQHGDDLLISTELVDVKDNKLLWRGQYNRKIADVVSLQGQIAQEILGKLRLKLTGGQKERLRKASTESAEAYQLYLQGRYFANKATDEARARSSEYFQKAIEKDPNYAEAYAALAHSYGAMSNYGQIPPKEGWRKAEEAAVKAIAINEEISQAHAELATVKMWYDWDWSGAEREFKRAIELNPDLTEAHLLFSSLLKATGRFDEAIAEVKQANVADPPRRNNYLGLILYQAGRYDEAIDNFQKALESGYDRGAVHLHLGEIYLKQGRNEAALAEVLKARPLVNRPRQLARIGYVYAAAGQKDEAIRILDEIRGVTGERYDLQTYIGCIYAALGKKEQAFAWLEKGLDDREYAVVDLQVDPLFDALRSEPRFTDVLRRVRLAP